MRWPDMPQVIKAPKRIHAHGQPPKTIEEFIGRAGSKKESVIARMVSSSGWTEPRDACQVFNLLCTQVAI